MNTYLINLLRILALALFLGGCGGGNGSDPTPQQDAEPLSITSIEVTPTNPSVALGTQQQFQATAIYSDGSTGDVTDQVVWSSSDTAIAISVNSAGHDGTMRAEAEGEVVISGSLNGISGTTNLTVTPAVLVSLQVTPTNPSIAAGISEQFTATGIFSDGTTQNLTASVTWGSLSNGIATVSNTSGNEGMVNSISEGITMISATAADSSLSANTRLTVTAAELVSIDVTPLNAFVPLGVPQQFTATGIYTDGTTQDITKVVVWRAEASAATISNDPGSQGLAIGEAGSSISISATDPDTNIRGWGMLITSYAELVSLSISPADPVIALGTNSQFTATGIYSDATTKDLTAEVTWGSSDSSVVTVSNAAGSKGLANSVGMGSTNISVLEPTSQISTTTTISISGPELVSLAIEPVNSNMAGGMTQQFTATGVYTDNSTQNLTSVVTWSSSDPSIATISNATNRGEVTATGEGNVTISASINGLSGATQLTVNTVTLSSIEVTPANPAAAAGTAQQFTATGVYSDGSTQDLTSSVTWSSSNGAVATISNAQESRGRVNALTEGNTTIAALDPSSSISGNTMLTVTPAQLVSLGITPFNPDIALGSSQQFAVTGTYSDGSSRDLTTEVTWSSTDSSVATVSNAAATEGLASSAGQGSTLITAVDPATGINASSALTVTAAVLTLLEVTPVDSEIPLGGSQQFIATGVFSDATTQSLTSSVTWSSSNPTVAFVSNMGGNEGRVGALTEGTTTISATHPTSGISGNTSLTVTPAQLVSLGITPFNPDIALGSSQQFTVTGTYSDGSSRDLTTAVTWNSADSSIATVSNAAATKGLATSVALGSTSITAIDPATGTNASSILTITAAVLVSLEITPVDSEIPLGTNQQFAVIGRYSDGSTQDLTNAVTWSSSDQGIASISNAPGNEGLTTTVAQAVATITATDPVTGVSDSTTLTVTPAVLASIAITPTAPSIANGAAQQFRAMGVYTDGSTVDVTNAVTWSTADSSVASISNASGTRGRASSMAIGTTAVTAIDPSTNVSGSSSLTVAPLTTARAYVTNQTPNTVSVIDTGTETLIGSIGVGSTPIGVATNSTTNRVYVTNSGSNTISVIDTDTNTVIDTVSVGNGPKGVAVNTATNRVYVTNSSSNTLTVIDATANINEVVATIDVGFGPEGVAVNPYTNRIYVANSGSGTVSVIDGSNNALVATVTVGSFPRGVAVNPANDRTYVANYSSKTISVIDNATNMVVATIDVKRCSYCSSRTPLGIATHASMPRIYVTLSDDNRLYIFDTDTNQIIAYPYLGSTRYTGGIAVNAGANRVYATYNDRYVYMFDTNSNRATSPFNIELAGRGEVTNPVGIAVIQ